MDCRFYCGRAGIAGCTPVLGVRDLFLGKQLRDGWSWRHRPTVDLAILGPLESIIGVLMCGVSVAFGLRSLRGSWAAKYDATNFRLLMCTGT